MHEKSLNVKIHIQILLRRPKELANQGKQEFKVLTDWLIFLGQA
jgi:hypothetical protein